MFKGLNGCKGLFLVLFIFCKCQTFVVAQNIEKWTNYTITEGLLENYVECVIEDNLGFLWIGTWAGISRYDGKEFRHYRKIVNDSLSLPGNWIYCLYRDKNGNIWAGTDVGLAIYIPRIDNFVPVKGIAGHSIIAITEDQNDNLWVAGDNHLYQVNKAKQVLIYHKKFNSTSYKSMEIGDIAIDNHDQLWIGTSNKGLLRFNLKTKEMKPLDNDLVNIKLSSTHIKAIQVDDDGSLWLASIQDGLFHLSPWDNKLENFTNKPSFHSRVGDLRIRDIYMDKNKTIWFVHSNGFITKYANHKFESIEIKKDLIHSNDPIPTKCIIIDKNGNEWIGTHGNGLLSRNRRNEKFVNFATSSVFNNGNKVASFLPIDSTKILVGTDGGGLYMFNPKSYKFLPINFDSKYKQSKILSMITTSTDIILGCWGNGLAILNKKALKLKTQIGQTSTLSNLDIKSMMKDDSLIWVASSGKGIFQFNTKNGQFNPLKMETENIPAPVWCNHLLKDKHNRVWISTSKGLYLKQDKNLQRFVANDNDSTAISSNLVVGTYQDSKNRIWILTDAGLQIYDEGSSSFKRSKKSAMQDQQPKAIIEDKKGNLWISSNHGIVCLDPLKNSIKQYTVLNGLPSNVYHHNAVAITPEGFLLFGGLNGFTYFHPDSLTAPSYSTKPVFTDFQINYISQSRLNNAADHIQTLSTITLPYANQTTTFKFTSIDLSNAQNVRYAYRLFPDDKQWIDIGDQNFVSFTNLYPGKYILFVITKNIDGLSSKEFAKLEINILPPWYLTRLAYVMYAIVLVGILYLLYYALTIRLRTKNKLILQRFEHKKKLELYKSKINFFTSISHDIRTPLTLIMAPLELLRSKIHENKDALKMLDIMDKNATNLLSLTNELLEFKNLESGERKLNLVLTDLMVIVQNSVDGFKNEAFLRGIRLEADLILCTTKIDVLLIERAISNLIINAFKFTQNQGLVKVTLFSDKKLISLSVHNSGSGIAQDLHSKIFDPFYTSKNERGFGLGLAIVKEIVQLHQGEIEVLNQNDGVTFTITLPKK